jgi:hypothetical protein
MPMQYQQEQDGSRFCRRCRFEVSRLSQDHPPAINDQIVTVDKRCLRG